MARSTTRKRKRSYVHPLRKSSNHTSGERKRSRGNRTRSRRRSSRRNRANYHTKYIKKQSKKRARAKGVGTEDEYNVDTSNWGQIQARRRADEKALQDKKVGEVLDLLSTRQGIHATSQSGPVVFNPPADPKEQQFLDRQKSPTAAKRRRHKRSSRPSPKKMDDTKKEKIKAEIMKCLGRMKYKVISFSTKPEIEEYNRDKTKVLSLQNDLAPIPLDKDIKKTFNAIINKRRDYLDEHPYIASIAKRKGEPM